MTVLRDGQTFSVVDGQKACELYDRLDNLGKFLFFMSVRSHVMTHDKTADGGARGKPVMGLKCRTKFQDLQSCQGCLMVNYHKVRLENPDST